MKVQEKIKPFEGTARFDKRPNAPGACPSFDKPNSIRLVEKTPLFIEDMTEDSTTKFMMIAETGIPAFKNNSTNGLLSARM
ncbi:Uncharacterised protein [Acinetobacter baumannii]|nr:Uncharacterised protein [Acinetobacter baumannii]